MNDFNDHNDALEFDLPKNPPSVIKVIGVGGGGGNAVNHMSTLGIRGVDFFVCNTDNQALLSSAVPNRIQLGRSLTEGLGAGANPDVGRQAAEESANEINDILESNTKMVFITAGMGGGTGTGAAPVIARLAKEAGILTVGILTTPFQFEGRSRLKQAEEGIEEMRKHVDSLIVINNNKLREVYGNLGFKAGFTKADEVVAIAVRGIAEVITHQYNINIDLRDAKTVLNNSGTAIMGSARATGENRAKDAIVRAMDSPLLNDNHIRGAKNVLLLIVSGQEEITIDEIGEINDHIQQQAGGGADIIMGVGEEDGLGNEIAVTVIATGFSTDKQEAVSVHKTKRIVHTLEEEQEVSQHIFEKPLKNDVPEETKPAPQPDLFSSAVERPVTPPKSKTQDPPHIDNSQPEDVPATPKDDEDVVMRFHLSDDDDTVPFSIDDVEEVEVSDAHNDEYVEDVQDAPAMSYSHDEMMRDEEPNTQDSLEDESQTVDESADDKMEPLAATPNEDEPVRFDLSDYMELEDRLKNATHSDHIEAKEAQNEPQDSDETLQFEVRKVAPKAAEKPQPTADNPFDAPISRSMDSRASERREQLQAFNHRFKNANQYVEELSSVPAYKRQGLDLQDEKPSKRETVGRLSVSDDENGPSLRGNNAFLHDNVD
jgi:cell division protein FtsZ